MRGKGQGVVAMFKKKVEFKGSAVVGGKDMKKLKKDVANSMGVSEEVASELFSHKVEITVKKVAQGGSKMHVGNAPHLLFLPCTLLM